MEDPCDDRISLEDASQILSIIGEVANAGGNDSSKRNRLMIRLAEVIGADYWTWVLGGNLENGFPTMTVFLHHGFSGEKLASYLEVQEHPDIEFLSGQFVRIMTETGQGFVGGPGGERRTGFDAVEPADPALPAGSLGDW